MRTLIFAAILSATLFTPIAIFAGEPDTKLHQKCIYPSVMVIGSTPNNTSVGTGVIVKSEQVKDKKVWINYFLSVAHILLPPEKVKTGEDAEGKPEYVDVKPTYFARFGVYKDWSRYTGYQQYVATIVHHETGVDKDIALFSFETDGPLPVCEIYKSPKLYIGNDVCRMGCGLGEAFRIDFGKITSVKESDDRLIDATKGTHRISAPTLPGDSGGPVYHEYKLIGICQTIRAMPSTGPFSPPQPVSFMVYVIPIERYLECKEIAKHIN